MKLLFAADVMPLTPECSSRGRYCARSSWKMQASIYEDTHRAHRARQRGVNSQGTLTPPPDSSLCSERQTVPGSLARQQASWDFSPGESALPTGTCWLHGPRRQARKRHVLLRPASG